MQHPNPFARFQLRSRIARFVADTSGAVTVDWIALTAALVAMVVAFFAGFTADIDGFLVTLMASL